MHGLAARQRERLQGFEFFGGARLGRLPDLLEQRGHGRLPAGHRVGQRVVGIARKAVQARLLVAQRQDLARDRAVVVLAGVLAAAGPGAPGLLAKITPLRKGQERHDV